MSTVGTRAEDRRRRSVLPAAPLWLVFAAVAVVLPALGKAPAIDEEGYLWIARHLDVFRPYDWARIWPPYDADAYAWAHPPLHLWWLHLCTALTGTPALLRAIAGLPWVVLFAGSVALLARRTCHHPSMAAALWLASPTVVLGLQDTWMIDLPAVALATAAVAAYREGLATEQRGWFVGSGVLLGLAIETKYSAALLLPVFAVHMRRHGLRPWVWAAAAAVVFGVEGPLWLAYGRPHPWEVWARRGEIAASGFGARALGTLVRGALLVVPLPLLLGQPALLAVGLAGALVAVVAASPAHMPVTVSTLLVGYAGLGAALLARGATAVLSPALRRRKGDRGDTLLLGGWLVAVFVAVATLHNYASARYLLPAAAPAALLMARTAEEVRWGKLLAYVAAGIAGVFAVGIGVADYRYVAAGVVVAEAAVEDVRARGGAPGRFAGEWSFRGAMEAAGWTRYRPDEVLPDGTWLIVADNASAGAAGFDGFEPLGRIDGADTFPIRVVDLDANVGLYAETLGVLPFGIGEGPLEGATIYRSRDAGERGGLRGVGIQGVSADAPSVP